MTIHTNTKYGILHHFGSHINNLLNAFRPRVSFKLESIYERLFGKTPENTHHAEGDVDSMIHCAAKYGQDFITWANNNAKLFAEIPPMRPGIKINS